MDNTQPVFIVTSGRSGSATLSRLLDQFDEVESHHEYMIQHVQLLSVRYHAGLITTAQAKIYLRKIYQAAIHYSRSPIWLDSSNKLSFLIKPLSELFLEAKWIYLVRDGRRVVSSFYNKLNDEIYDDRSTQIMIDYMCRDNEIIPPPEKKYWWPIPRLNWENHPFQDFDQFQRICWYWQEVNAQIMDHLYQLVPEDRRMKINLELLTGSELNTLLSDLLEGLLKVDFSFEKINRLRSMLKRPHNVSEPVSHPLTDEQNEQFWSICGDMMRELGYNDEDYEVIYHPED